MEQVIINNNKIIIYLLEKEEEEGIMYTSNTFKKPISDFKQEKHKAFLKFLLITA